MNRKFTLTLLSMILCFNIIPCKTRVCANTSNVNVYTKFVSSNSNTLREDLKIPQLKNGINLNILKNINNDLMKLPLEITKTQTKEAKENYDYSIKNNIPFRPFEVVSDYKVNLLKGNYLSITEDIYTYSGGAHGITLRIPFNYDTSTGKKLKLRDIFPVGYNYKTPINNFIEKEIINPKENQYYFENAFKGINENTNFYLEEGNLVIYFPLYEIAPYAMGIPEFRIPLNYFKPSLKI